MTGNQDQGVRAAAGELGSNSSANASRCTRDDDGRRSCPGKGHGGGINRPASIDPYLRKAFERMWPACRSRPSPLGLLFAEPRTGMLECGASSMFRNRAEVRVAAAAVRAHHDQVAARAPWRCR